MSTDIRTPGTLAEAPARSGFSRRALLAGGIGLPFLAAAGTGTATAMSPENFHPAAGLQFVDGSPWVHPEIRSVDFRVSAPGVQVYPPSIRVTVPEGYADSDKRYPVLVLLHGQAGNFLQWTVEGRAHERTAGHDVILVMPDGGSGSFYSNANFPLPGREAAFETFIMEHALPFVHENFRTDPDRMAIAGLSMGGWGALALGQKYGSFRSMSSYSGPADCRPQTLDGLGVALAIWASPGLELLRTGGAIGNHPGSTWGTPNDPGLASSYNPIEHIEAYRDRRVFMRTGTGAWGDLFPELMQSPDLVADLQRRAAAYDGLFSEVVEQAVHPNQERFSHALADAGIGNDFAVIDGASHNWDLWGPALEEDMPGIMEALNA